MLRVDRVRAPLVLALLSAGAVAAGTIHPAAAAADSGSGSPLTLGVTGPSTLPYRSQDVLQVTIGPNDSTATGTLHVESTPSAGGPPTVVLDGPAQPGTDPVLVPVVGDVSRHYLVSFVSDDEARWPSPAPVPFDIVVTQVRTVASLAVVTAPASNAPARPGAVVWRSFGATARLRLLDTDGAPVAGAAVTLQHRSVDTKNTWATLRTATTDANGRASTAVNPWYDTSYRVLFGGSSGQFAAAQSADVLVRPRTPGVPVLAPSGSPHPAGAAPAFGRGYGVGANAVVTAIPNPVWASMQGYSYGASTRCPVGRSKLSYITVNYWGFDGNRYRGELVVARNRAGAFARAFTTLYDLRFPIRSMVRPDRFGRSPHGWPGANDYASMAHDNTYAFNCRYVVGKEGARVMSPHAYGYAVDLNTWENPDIAANGTHPNAWFAAHRSARYGGVITPGSPVVKAFRTAGLGWGGSTIGDFQHFDPTLL